MKAKNKKGRFKVLKIFSLSQYPLFCCFKLFTWKLTKQNTQNKSSFLYYTMTTKIVCRPTCWIRWEATEMIHWHCQSLSYRTIILLLSRNTFLLRAQPKVKKTRGVNNIIFDRKVTDNVILCIISLFWIIFWCLISCNFAPFPLLPSEWMKLVTLETVTRLKTCHL